MSYQSSSNGASGSMFVSAVRLVSNVSACGVVYFVAPYLFGETIMLARDYAYTHIPLVVPYIGWMWALGCGLLTFAFAQASLSTAMMATAFKLVRRM